MNVFEKVNNLTAAQILARVNVEPAKVGKGYICPNSDCKHGAGGEGVEPTIYKGEVRWHCYSCDRHMSNSDFAAATLGIDASIDKAGAAAALSELFGLSGDEDETQSETRNDEESARRDGGKGINLKAHGWDEVKEYDGSEPKDYSRLFYVCRRNVTKFLSEHGGSYRGLKLATFMKYGLGINFEFKFPDGTIRPALVIPYVKGTKVDKYHGVARSIDKETDGTRKLRQMGTNAPLFEPLPITSTGVNIILESEIDALSVAQVIDGYDDVGCIATGGAGKYRKVITELNERFSNAERRPKFIVAFDNDSKGDEKGRELVDELKKNRYPATKIFFGGQLAGEYEYKHGGEVEIVTIPKVDANSLLQAGGGKLFEHLLDAITQTTDTLDEQAAAIQSTPALPKENVTEPADKTTEPPQPSPQNETSDPSQEKPARAVERDGIASISVSEYFSDKFLIDVARTSKYSTRKTGFKNLDGDADGNNVKLTLVPGLYLVGGLPSVGKSTFSNQLVEQLADAGEYCIFCSYEMTQLEMFSKSLSRKLFKLKRSGHDVVPLSSFDIRRGRGLHLPEIQDAIKELQASTSQLCIAELSNTPVKQLFQWLRPRIASATKSPICVIDYAQILPVDKDNRRDGLDDVLRGLKVFQRETDATFIVISSFNRANYWQDVSFESFKESGGLEYSADALLGLEVFVKVPENGDAKAYNAARKKAITDAARKAERTIKFSCLKNRNGAPFTVYFRYHAPYDYFEPINENAANDAAAVEDDDDIE